MRITRMNAVLLARELRKNQTKTEQKVWSYLRNRKYHGYKFVRQYPFYYDIIHFNTQFFIADFYCAELKWILELDGQIHNSADKKKYDEDRNTIMIQRGMKVIRIKNEEVLNKDSFYEILNKILVSSLNK